MNNFNIAIRGKLGSGKDTTYDMLNFLISSSGYLNISTYGHYLNLKDSIRYGTNNIKFADAIKDTICSWLGCTRAKLEDREFKNTHLGKEWWIFETFDNANKRQIFSYMKHKDLFDERALVKLTPRLLLQLLGTEAGRNILHPDIWVNIAFNKLKLDENNIITDLRFINEYERCATNNFTFIFLHRHLGLRLNLQPEIFGVKSIIDVPEPEIMRYLSQQQPEIISVITHESETALDYYTSPDALNHSLFDITNNGLREDLFNNLKSIIL